MLMSETLNKVSHGVCFPNVVNIHFVKICSVRYFFFNYWDGLLYCRQVQNVYVFESLKSYCLLSRF